MEFQHAQPKQHHEVWKILVIDDDEDDFLIAKTMLTEAKGRTFAMQWASTYEAGQAALISNHYNAVLVDYDLGLHSGIELIREANARGYPSPLILFTGRGSYDVDVEAMEAGATLYLSKGEATPLLLERAIRYAIELKQKEQSLRASEAALRMSEAKERAKVAELNAIMDAVPAIVWITHDPQANEVTGNQAAHDLLRVPVGQNLSKSALEDAPSKFKVYQDGRELAQEELPLQVTAATGKPIRNFEEEVIFEDGDHVQLLGNVSPLLDDDGNPSGAVAAFMNITDRKRVEQDLAQKEAELTEAQRIAHIGNWYWDAATDVTIGSDELSRIFGLDPATQPMPAFREQKGRFYSPETWERLNKAVEKTMQTGIGYALDLPAFHSSDPIWITTRGEAVRDASGRIVGLRGTVQDITERKQAEEAIRQAHQKAIWLARFPDENPNPVARVSADGVTLYCNGTSAMLPGWNCTVGQPLTDPIMRLAERAMTQGQAVREDVLLSERYYAITVMPIREANYANIYGTDITERKRTEQALQASEVRLTEFLNSTHDSFFILDHDWRFLYINRRAAELLKKSPQELVGKVYWEEFPRYIGTPAEQYYRQAMSERVPVHFEHGGVYSNFFYEVSIYPTGDGIAVVGTNRTEEKKAQQALQAAYARLRFLMDANMVGVTLYQEDGTLLDSNDYYLRLIGVTREEFEAGPINWRTFTPAEYLSLDDQSIAELKENGISHTYEKQYRRSDGSRVWVNISRALLPDGTLAALIFDITGRKQVEQSLRESNEALRESQERFERAQQIAHLGSWELDLIDNVLTWSNEIYRIFGLHPQEFAATYEAFLEHVHPDDRGAVDAAYSSSIKENRDSYEIEHRVIRKHTGEIRFVHEKCEHIRNAAGQIIRSAGMVHDITDRKQAELALRKSEEKFAKSFRSSPVAIAISTLADGRFIEVNESYTQLFEFSKDEIVGRTSVELGMFPDPKDREEFARQFRAGGGVHNYELRLLTKSGDLRDVLFSSEPIEVDGQDCLLSLVVDITERKQAEQALHQYTEELRASEERFRQLADAMPQLVWTASPDGTIDYLNQRYKEYEGFTQIDGRGWDWGNAIHPEDEQGLMTSWNRVVQSGAYQQDEFRMRMADGTYRWHLARGIPIKDEAGKIIRWIGTNTDIEDQKQTEERLRQSNWELEQFAFVASHDLQEPLRKIRLFGTTIQKKLAGSLDEDTKDKFERMISASQRMQEMIKDLLDLSRVNTQGRPFVTVNLEDVAAEVVSDLEAQILKTGGKVMIGELPQIEADPLQMHQVFQNVISNALKFHPQDIPPVVKITGTMLKSRPDRENMVSIQVEDNGIGFETEHFEKMLLPFQRLHGRGEFEGTGIGLAIVKKIIDRHHGKITAISRPGEGSTFIITLPVKQNY